MTQTQISPISAAEHYATSATFWEGQAKLLRHSLDDANDLVSKLQAVIAHGTPEQLAAARTQLLPPVPMADQPAPAPSEPELPAD